VKKFFGILSLILFAVGVVFWQNDLFLVKTTILTFMNLTPGTVLVGLAMAGVAAPFPTDNRLVSVVVAYKNAKLIADEVAPRVPAGTKAFKYKKYAKEDSFTIPDTSVGRTSKPNVVNFGFEEVDSSCSDHALDGLVPQDDIDNAPDGYDPEAHQAESVRDLILLDREKRVADLVFATSSYAATNRKALEGTAQFSHASSDPLKTVLEALDVPIMRPNIMVFGQSVWTKFRQHAKIVKATHGNSGDAGVAARQAVAELLEVDEILVGEGWYNPGKKGQTVSVQRMWGNYLALLYRDKLATLNGDRITFAMTAQFGHPGAGSISDPDIGAKGGKRVRVWEQVKELVTANDLGYLFSDVIAIA